MIITREVVQDQQSYTKENIKLILFFGTVSYFMKYVIITTFNTYFPSHTSYVK